MGVARYAEMRDRPENWSAELDPEDVVFLTDDAR